MRYILNISLVLSSFLITAQTQLAQDNFDGNSTITSWFGDDCGMDNNFLNPFIGGINTSSKVLRYNDTGGQYANVRFNAGFNFNLNGSSVFSLKIYVPSSSLTGTQANQISLKLQNGTLTSPWATQSEIIKPIQLNQWQTITFDFANDPFINLNPTSINPIYRTDFNRVVLQINGENNTSLATAFLDDFLYTSTPFQFTNLVWSDEFDGTGAINLTKWHHQTQLPNGTGWYNGELQHYTNRQVNSSQSNGILTLLAKKEVFTNQGQTKQYTSARLNSKFAFKYGRVEVRAKLPSGVGTWPAIWMLSKNIIEPGAFWTSAFGTTGWPDCGEIDIMEHWGNNQDYVQSALHTRSSFGNTENKGGQIIANASTQFHVYSMEWTANSIIFSIDNNVHYVYNPTVKNEETWPFNNEQYILLNIAIEPSIASNFVQSALEVDYVRVYQQPTLSNINPTNKSEFVLFPNPTTSELSINIDESKIGSVIEIYSMLGQLMQKSTLQGTNSTIFVSAFPRGIYFAKFIDQIGNSTTCKFIKE